MREALRVLGRLHRNAANPVVGVLLHHALHLVELMQNGLVPAVRKLNGLLLKRGKSWRNLAEPGQGLLVLGFEQAQGEEVLVFFSHGPKVGC